MSGREEFAVVRMTLKRLALPSVVLYRPKTDSLHLPPEANDGTVYGRAIAYLVDENGLTYTGTDLVDLGLAAPALLAAFDAQAARIAELEAALAGDAVAVVDVARWESAAKEGK